MTQKDEILKYLQTHKKGLTSKEAIDKFGCTRLAGQIWNLKHKEGWNIKSVTECVPNRYGRNVPVSRYKLEV